MNLLRCVTLKKIIRPTIIFPITALPVLCHCLNLRVVKALVLVAVLCLASEAWACPTCKDGIAENDPGSQAMAAGYFYSILFMMAMPFVIICTFGSFAYFSVRKARQAETLSADVSHVEVT